MSGGGKVVDLVAKGADGQLKRRPKSGAIKWPRVYPDDHPRAGKPVSCLENTKAMLDHYGSVVSFNLMTHRGEIDVGVHLEGVAAERRMNAAQAQIRIWARQHGLSAGKALDDHIEILISTRSYHPVADWIRSKPWDGVDRITDLFNSLTLELAYAREHSAHALRLLTAWLVTGAMAALLPATAREGIAAQGVLVLQGEQGTGKTRWIMSLVPPGNGWAQESVLIDPTSRDSREAATKCWLSEIGEVDATFRKADIAALKGFLTQRVDTYRKAYDRAPEDIARRTFFVASVNPRQFLVDDTGSRRYWTIATTRCNPHHGIDLQQLWAQAASLAESDPDLAWLDEAEAAHLQATNATFDAVDPIWESLTRTYETTEDDVWCSLDDIKAGVDSQRNWSVSDARHLARLLKSKLKARSRILHGYTLYAVIRWTSGPS